MKKFISLIALVGVFAACEPENLQTAFSVSPATATVKATVWCPAPGFNAADANVTYAWSNGETSQSISGTDKVPAIEAGTVTVTATWEGATKSEVVSFPKLYAGMTPLELEVYIMLPYNAGGYMIDSEVIDESKETVLYVLQAAAHGHGYNDGETFDAEYDGVTYNVPMMENASEFILEDSYTWYKYEGAELQDDLVITNNDFKAEAQDVYEAAAKTFSTGIVPLKKSYDFAVGAWSLYNVINPEVTTITTVAITATPLLGSNNPEIPAVATYSYKKTVAVCGAVEMAHPDHASHYVPHSGHYTHDGHAIHGDNNNAGGGIVEAE